MTVETLLAKLKTELDEAFELLHEYEEEELKCLSIHDNNSAAYYEHRVKVHHQRVTDLLFVINTIKDRAA